LAGPGVNPPCDTLISAPIFIPIRCLFSVPVGSLPLAVSGKPLPVARGPSRETGNGLLHTGGGWRVTANGYGLRGTD
jgi:hypothetical protein